MFLRQANFSAVNSPAALVAVVSVVVTVAAESTYPAPYHGPQSPKGVRLRAMLTSARIVQSLMYDVPG